MTLHVYNILTECRWMLSVGRFLPIPQRPAGVGDALGYYQQESPDLFANNTSLYEEFSNGEKYNNYRSEAGASCH